MPENRPLRALVWDMGGVLVRNMDPSIRGRLGAPFGLGSMQLEDLFFNSKIANQASIGLATEEDAWEYVRQQLNLKLEEIPGFRATFWSCDRFDEDLYALSMMLRPRIKIGLLSNAFPETRVRLGQRFPNFYRMFDVTIYSYEVGMAKPDPRIYQLELERLGVDPQEAVFVDDFIENVAGARAVGMLAIQFKNSRQVQDEIRELFK